MKKHMAFLLLSINVSCFAMESGDNPQFNTSAPIACTHITQCSTAIARAVEKNIELEKEKKQLEQEVTQLKESHASHQQHFIRLNQQVRDATDRQTVAEYECEKLSEQLQKAQAFAQTLLTLYTNHITEYIALQQQQNTIITRMLEQQQEQWLEHKELIKTQLALHLHNSSYKRGTFFDEEGIDEVEHFTNNQIMSYLRSLVINMKQLKTRRRVPVTTPAPPNTPHETCQFELDELSENQ
ncbi:MAG TPA: hypothetical protein PLU71_01770 [Candidatus Dependentiae bacterium]|nr:hypothetical protein [Candidatus Dependentiae bacterium]HRQ62559.1 hypothetical protein [Candidatus Dependentiae bacterium]